MPKVVIKRLFLLLDVLLLDVLLLGGGAHVLRLRLLLVIVKPWTEVVGANRDDRFIANIVVEALDDLHLH